MKKHQEMREISKGINIVDLSLWLPKEKTIIINDLHLGYEEALHHKGILLPKFQLQEIIKQMAQILKKVKTETVILNGDVKHEFGTVLRQEWKDVLQFLDFLATRVSKIIIIQGNHDPLLKPIALRRGIDVVKQHKMANTLVVHGDALIKTDAKRIIIGHEHPAVTIREGSKREKYKCFLKGIWKGKEVFAVPSFNPLLEGTDVLKEKVLSPYLADVRNFHVFAVSRGEVFGFGKLKNIPTQ